jgi:hypothetical protein
MIWKANYIDGKSDVEFQNGQEGNFLSIDKSKLLSFMIVESGNDMMIGFSADNGNFRFPNLDLRRLVDLNREETLKLVYDPDVQNFKMDVESLKLYNSLKLTEQDTFNQIEFDQTGMFFLNGEPFYLSFSMNGQPDLDLINQDQYDEIIHRKQAYTDFRGKRNSDTPYKRIDDVEGYYIGYRRSCSFGDLQFNLSLVLYYEVIHRTVTMHCQLGCNKNVDGKLVLHLGDKIHTIPTTIISHLPAMNFDRTLTQL